MAYDLARSSLRKSEDIQLYIKEYGGWVEIDKDMLPDCSFEYMGAQGPQQKQMKAQQKVQSLMLAAKIDQLKMQMGGKMRLDLDAAIDEILREGGWDDISGIVAAGGTAQGGPQPSGLPGPPGGNPGAASVALEGLNGASGGQV